MTPSSTHPYAHTLASFSTAAGKKGRFFSLPALAASHPGVARLPHSLRIVLESVLRHCDGHKVAPQHVEQLASWRANAPRTEEIPFVVARVLLQDFTGVPLLADLAAMRNAAVRLGHDPKRIEPLVPVDLVVDHSVMIDHYASKKALDLNMRLEFKRNLERYQFMKWGMDAFRTFGVVPPGFGIVHQVNLEYLARGVHRSASGVCYPDTLVGTDSHTTMINGIGVVGWGVGGIEAEAAMLGQPVHLLTPDVVGVELTGCLREGVTATDLVLTVTELLRSAKVVGQFVEFCGEGTRSLSLPDRATIANMAPEYGATMGFFPVDEKTIAYFKGTGRRKGEIEAFEAYFKAQGLFGVPQAARHLKTHHVRREHVDRLAQHGGFGLDAAHAPAHHTNAIDHGGVAVGAHQGIGVVNALLLVDTPRQVLQVDLVHDAKARWHHTEGVKGLHAPLHKFIAFAVALELKLHVQVQRLLGTEVVHHDGVVHHQVHRHKGFNFFGVGAQLARCAAHRGQIDQQGHASEVLQHHPGHHKRNFFGTRSLGFPLRHLGHVLGGDLFAIAVAQHRFEHDAHGHWQAGNAWVGFGQHGQRVVLPCFA